MIQRMLPVLLCFLVAPVKAADWPQWRGPDRTDISKETGLLKTWPKEGPKLVWTFDKAGKGYSGFAVVGKVLYTMSAIEDKEFVVALDAETGKKIWESEVGALLTNGWGDGPRCTPAVDGEHLYAIGGKGTLICMKVKDGAKVWDVSLTGALGGKVPNWGYCESPLVDGDWVLCSPGGNKGGIAALDKKNGQVVWQSTDLKDPAGYSSIIIAEVGGLKQYINTTMKGIVGVRAKDGKLMWRHEQPMYRTAVIPTPVYRDGHVYATSGYGAGCDLLKLTSTGKDPTKDTTSAEKVYYNTTMVNHHGGVVLVGDHIYGYSDKGGWLCQDFLTGKEVWKDRGVGKGSVTCADGKLYCFSETDGTVALIDASPAGWKEHGRFKMPKQTGIRSPRGKIWTHPVIANGKLYLRDQDLIFCFDIKE